MKVGKFDLRLFVLFLLCIATSISTYGQYTGTGIFNKISSIGDLTDGYYVVVNSGDAVAMNNTNAGSFFTTTSIVSVNNTITNPSSAIVWYIETDGGGRTIYNEETAKYVSYTGSSNSAQAVDEVVSDNQRWVISYVDDLFTFSNLAISNRVLQYNASSPRFACYTSSQQRILLYKLDESGSTENPEPTHHVTNFQAQLNGFTSVDLTWDDASEGDLPLGYLLLANTTNIFDDPVDGVDPEVDVDLSDGSALVKVAQGIQGYTFSNLLSETTYYFKIYPYSNFGDTIDFKTDGDVPTASIQTFELPCLTETFDSGIPVDWIQTGVSYNSSLDLLELSAGTSSVILSPVANPSFLSFDLSRTTNTTAKTLHIEVSTEGSSGNFETLSSYDHSNTPSGGTLNIEIDLSNYLFYDQVYIRLRKESSTTSPWRVDNVVIECDSDFQGTVWSENSWSNGVPDTDTNVLILDHYNSGTHGVFTAKSLTVQSGIFTITSGTSIEIEEAVINNSDASGFIVENDANLIQVNDVSNSGAITVNRDSHPLYRLDYTLWSSPVIGQNLKAFSSETLTNRFYVYNTAGSDEGNNNGAYETVLTEANEGIYEFETAKGYLIRTPNTHIEYEEGVSGEVYQGTFIGIPGNGTVTFTLDNTNTGYNLIGNPYPSSIDLEDFLTANADAIDGTIWLWRKRNGESGSGYATANNTGVTSVQPGISNPDADIQIRTGQGFFVKVKENPTESSVVFLNSMRSNNTNGMFYRTNQGIDRHRIWINLSKEDQVVSQLLIGYVGGATDGVDYGFDGKPFGEVPISLTSLIDSEFYSIQARSLPFTFSDIVPLALKTEESGSFNISLSQVDGIFAEGQEVYVHDKELGIYHNLSESVYEFTSSAGLFTSRFEIVYQNEALTVEDFNSPKMTVFLRDGELTIKSYNNLIDSVEIFDIQGRILFYENHMQISEKVVPCQYSNTSIVVVRVKTQEGNLFIHKIAL